MRTKVHIMYNALKAEDSLHKLLCIRAHAREANFSFIFHNRKHASLKKKSQFCGPLTIPSRKFPI